MTLVTGFDPDTHTAPWATVTLDGTIVGVGLFESKRQKGADSAARMAEVIASSPRPTCSSYLVIENQDAYFSGTTTKKARAEDLISLSFVGGAFAGQFPGARILRPLPAQWKGQVPKAVHQGRILTALGLKYETTGGASGDGYCVPLDPEPKIPGGSKLPKSAWKHVVDAIGLALWGVAEIKKLADLERFKANAS